MDSLKVSNISEQISFSQLSEISDSEESVTKNKDEYEDESNMTDEQKKELMIKSYTKIKSMKFYF